MSSRHIHAQHCQCHASTLMVENLDEVKFKKSICGAAVDGDVERVRRLLCKDPVHNLYTDGVNDTSGYTPLHYAARGGHVRVVKLLLEHGANPNAQTRGGRSTPLHRAAYCGHEAVVSLLLRYGADPTLIDNDGFYPKDKAKAKGHLQIEELLEDYSNKQSK